MELTLSLGNSDMNGNTGCGFYYGTESGSMTNILSLPETDLAHVGTSGAVYTVSSTAFTDGWVYDPATLTSGATTLTFDSSTITYTLTGLSEETTYYFRAYSDFPAGTTLYGDTLSFTTVPEPAEVAGLAGLAVLFVALRRRKTK